MKKPLFWLLVVFFPIFAPFPASSQNLPTKFNPEDEKRSAIVEAHGYAYISEDKTIKILRQEAYASAKRLAAESAQTHIQSLSQVENFTLTYDLIQTQTDAVVRVLEHKDLGIEEGKRYHVWIKAEVQYRLGKTSKEELVPLSSPQAPLTVKMWTDKKKYQQGEEMKIYLQGNKPFYAKVIYTNVLGKILQLLPNAYRTQNFFEGGTVYSIPGHGDRFKLDVHPPFGPESIKIFASTSPLGEIHLNKLDSGIYSYEGDQEGLSQNVRSVVITPVKPDRPSEGKAEFYEAGWQVQTQGF